MEVSPITSPKIIPKKGEIPSGSLFSSGQSGNQMKFSGEQNLFGSSFPSTGFSSNTSITNAPPGGLFAANNAPANTPSSGGLFGQATSSTSSTSQSLFPTLNTGNQLPQGNLFSSSTQNVSGFSAPGTSNVSKH